MLKAENRMMAGLTIVVLAAMFWMAFGILEFLSDTSSAAGLIEGGLVGGILLLSGYAAYRWRCCGGWILVFEGVLPIAFTIARGQFNPLAMLVVAGPPIVGGILFLLD